MRNSKYTCYGSNNKPRFKPEYVEVLVNCILDIVWENGIYADKKIVDILIILEEARTNGECPRKEIRKLVRNAIGKLAMWKE